jgi:hypothetical protein
VNNSGGSAATNVQVTDNLPTGTGITWSESPDNPNCTIAANVLSCTFASLAAGATATVHVTSPTTEASCGTYGNTASFTSGNAGTGSASDTTVVKCPPPPSGEGCTPGFWKQDHHLDSWVTFSPNQLISSVFNTSAVPNLGSQTLQQGLSFKGGPDIDGGAQILLRAAIASLLNSTALNFSLSSAQIISQVNTALTSGSRDAMITLAGTLDALNNGRCPLN